jgi:cytochrome b
MVRVWDRFVMFTHWTVAVGYVVAYLTGEGALLIHVWAGYTVGALVVLRILWGFVGPKHARFTDFVFRPWKVLSYLGDLVRFRAQRYLGHSPAGGAMAIALWIGLLALVWSGLELYAVEEGAGPLASVGAQMDHGSAMSGGLIVSASASDDDEGDQAGGGGGAWKDIHESLSSLVLVLVILHLVGVVLSSLVHRENLPRSMVTGMKRDE